MVDLPHVSRNMPLTRAPQPGVSPSQIQSAYNSIANALGNIGDTLGQEAQKDAQKNDRAEAIQAQIAGTNAVVRAPDGTLQAQLQPWDAKHGDDYNTALLKADEARSNTDIQVKASEIATAAKGNPDQFAAEWKKFGDDYLSKSLPELHGALTATLEREGAQSLAGLMAAKANTDLARFGEDLKSRADLLDREMTGLAMDGAANSPAYSQRRDELLRTLNDMAKIPGTKYSETQAKADFDRIEAEHLGAATVGGIVKVYHDTGSMEAALQQAEAIINDPKVPLSLSERHQFVGLAKQQLAEINAQLKTNFEGYEPAAKAVYERVQAGGRINDPDVNDTIEQLKKFGPYGVPMALKLMQERRFQQQKIAAAHFSDAQAADALQTMKTGQQPGTPLFLATPTAPNGMVTQGNIDLNTRPHVQNIDGSVSTVRSMSFEEDGKEILIPTVSDDGRILTSQEAVAEYHRTGRHLGIFDNAADADAYAKMLHEQQAASLHHRPDIASRSRMETARGSYVDKVVGAESRGVATAKNPRSSATGAGQFIESTWREFIQERHPELAKGDVLGLRKNKALSYEATEWYAQKNAAQLQAAGLPVNDGTKYLAHFAGPGDAVKLLKAAPDTPATQVMDPRSVAANPFVKRMTAGEVVNWAARKMGGGGATATAQTDVTDPRMIGELQQRVTDDLKRHWDDVELGLKAGMPPAPETVDLMTKELGLVDDPNLKAKITTTFEGLTAGYNLAGYPADAQERAMATVRANLGQDGYTETESRFLASMEASRAAEAERLSKNPQGFAQDRGLVKQPDPIDFASAPSVSTGMAQRSANAMLIQQTFGKPDVPVFQPQEAKVVGEVIAHGAPEQATNAMAAIAGLPDKVLMPTLAQKDIKEAIQGAARSTDPVRFGSAMSALDSMWRRAPEDVAKEFGEDTIKTMQDWQAKLRYYTPNEIAAALKERGDPQFQQRMKTLEDAGQAIANKERTPESVAAEFDRGWFDYLPRTAPDTLTRNQLMADYATVFGERYAATLDKDTAHKQTMERLKTGGWGTSAVNNGRLMLYPPEQRYSAVNGSYDWMKQELQRDLTMLLGKVPSDYALVGDAYTRASIQAGKPADYLVEVVDPRTGFLDVARNPDGKPYRIAFTQPPNVDKSEDFRQQQKRVFQEPQDRFDQMRQSQQALPAAPPPLALPGDAQ